MSYPTLIGSGMEVLRNSIRQRKEFGCRLYEEAQTVQRITRDFTSADRAVTVAYDRLHANGAHHPVVAALVTGILALKNKI